MRVLHSIGAPNSQIIKNDDSVVLPPTRQTSLDCRNERQEGRKFRDVEIIEKSEIIIIKKEVSDRV